MPASYVHQCVAAQACDALALFSNPDERHALLAGAEGPDPLFFSFLNKPGTPFAPRVGSILHTQKTDDFLIALSDACAHTPLLRAYCCGFFTHYATDTTYHPFVYAHALTQQGTYSAHLHCLLEHQYETLLYRRQGHPSGLPVQMAGFAALSPEQRAQIAQALSTAIAKTFPALSLSAAHLTRCFQDAVSLCRLLRSESGKKFHVLGTVLAPFRLDLPLHAHMLPLELPAKDIANDAHAPWASIWTPDEMRTDSFEDLFASASLRSQTLVFAALSYMNQETACASLRALHGGFSYDSGLPWQSSCAAKDAPGIKKP